MRSVLSTAVLWAGFVLAACAGDRVLCLYKGGEGATERENEIRWHLAEHLTKVGCETVYHDLDSGLPEPADAEDAKAVVTWCRTAAMKGAAAYARWLKGQVDAGRRVIVFGSYGAFQEAEGGRYLPAEEVNVFFRSIGYEYLGRWTDDPAKIRVALVHPMLDAGEKSPALENPSFYLQFRAVAPGNLNLLVLRRSDLEDSDSTMIGINEHGAIAFAPYVLENAAAPGQPPRFLFDRQRFLQTALSFKAPAAGRQVLCLYKSADGQDADNNEIAWHLQGALKAAGWTTRFHDASAGLPPAAEAERAAAVITWFRSPQMKGAKAYIQWLTGMGSRGKRVVVLGAMGAHKEAGAEAWLDAETVNRAFRMLGLDFRGQWTDRKELLKLTRLDQEFFPGGTLAEDFPGLGHYIQILPLHPKARALLEIQRTDLPDGRSVPVVLTPYGGYAEGRFIFGPAAAGVQAKPYLDVRKFVAEALQ